MTVKKNNGTPASNSPQRLPEISGHCGGFFRRGRRGHVLQQRGADHRAVGKFPHLADALAILDAKSNHELLFRVLADALQVLGDLLVHARAVELARAGGGVDREAVGEVSGHAVDQLDPLRRRDRRDEVDHRKAEVFGAFEKILGLLWRQVGNQQAVHASLDRVVHEAVATVRDERIAVAHEQNRRRDLLAPLAIPRFSDHLENAADVHAVADRLVRRVLDHWPVADGIGVGHPEFDEVGPALLQRFEHGQSRARNGKFRHIVGDEQLLVLLHQPGDSVLFHR